MGVRSWARLSPSGKVINYDQKGHNEQAAVWTAGLKNAGAELWLLYWEKVLLLKFAQGKVKYTAYRCRMRHLRQVPDF